MKVWPRFTRRFATNAMSLLPSASNACNARSLPCQLNRWRSRLQLTRRTQCQDSFPSHRTTIVDTMRLGSKGPSVKQNVTDCSRTMQCEQTVHTRVLSTLIPPDKRRASTPGRKSSVHSLPRAPAVKTAACEQSSSQPETRKRGGHVVPLLLQVNASTYGGGASQKVGDSDL